MRRTRGFTLIELMTVVTIIGVMASVAVIALRRDRSEGDADAWANSVRNIVIQARRRAVATGTPYMVELRAKKAQWCAIKQSDCSGAQPMTCAPPIGEAGQPMFAGSDAITDSYATQADVAMPGSTFAAPTHTTLGSGVLQLFFGPNGSIDASLCSNVLGSITTGLTGVTAYVRASNVTATSSSAAQKHRRVVVYGATGRPRIIDNW